MKNFPALLAATAALLAVAGCTNLDTTPDAPADRVVTGVIVIEPGLPDNAPLPPDAEVRVRVIDVMSDRAALANVLGEQVIKNPGALPIEFKVEFTAEDAVLRRQVNLDARISIGGKLAFFSRLGHPILTTNAARPHRLVLEAVGGR